MIPELEDGVLPDGVHDCTLDEIVVAFGRFQKSDQRIRLTERLKSYLTDAARSGIVIAVLIDGSYVTAKEEPEDIDMIVVRRRPQTGRLPCLKLLPRRDESRSHATGVGHSAV